MTIAPPPAMLENPYGVRSTWTFSFRSNKNSSTGCNSGKPSMGAYSLCSCFSIILASAQRTQGSTQGLPESSRYAPTPRLRRFVFLSRLNASVTPRIGSGGPISTSSNQALPRLFKPSAALDCKTRPVGRKFKILKILLMVRVCAERLEVWEFCPFCLYRLERRFTGLIGPLLSFPKRKFYYVVSVVAYE
uniref:Uncharacterized protein n=1 Tax=Glossina austeni TaxID=7395 RepID=A0A1A9V4K7_GLOAU